MERSPQINNVTILSFFLTIGGLTIVNIAEPAATKEHTTAILVIVKNTRHIWQAQESVFQVEQAARVESGIKETSKGFDL